MKNQPNIDQCALDLINGGIDAELSSAEQEILASLLAESSDALKISNELNSIVEFIEGAPEIESPEYLQESIERQIRLPAQDAAPRGKQGVFGNWLSANWVRTGFAFAAGVALTVGVFEMGSQPISEQDATKLVGTVVKNQGTVQGKLLDRINISDDRMNGLVELREKDGLFTLDVRLRSDGSTEVVVNFAGRGMSFEGVTRRQDRNDKVTVGDGSVNVAGSGEQSYTLNIRRNTDTLKKQLTPLELGFYANNVLVHEAELNISRY